MRCLIQLIVQSDNVYIPLIFCIPSSLQLYNQKTFLLINIDLLFKKD